jgi:DNA repair exonuclease SbcCD ATPase subunit
VEIREKNERIARLEAENKRLDEEGAMLSRALTCKNETVIELEKRLETIEAEIAALRAKVERLEAPTVSVDSGCRLCNHADLRTWTPLADTPICRECSRNGGAVDNYAPIAARAQEPKEKP